MKTTFDFGLYSKLADSGTIPPPFLRNLYENINVEL